MIIFEAERIVNVKTICIDNAYLDKDRDCLPEEPGLYFVFVGKVEHRPDNSFRMESPRLIYIGKAKDINDRHNTENGSHKHEHYPDFLGEKGDDEEIAYAVAVIPEFFDRRLIESALIYQFKPCINIKDKFSFNHRPTRISIESKIEFPYVGTFDVAEDSK